VVLRGRQKGHGDPNKGDVTVHLYGQIYEFAASAGALEGYVYERTQIDMQALAIWANNLLDAYRILPPDVRDTCQSSCDRTLGRAILSLNISDE
jgi:hypothetical protein